MHWVVLGALAALLGWQVYRGVVIGGDWRLWYRRSAQPARFWAVVAAQFAIVLAVAILWLSVR